MRAQHWKAALAIVPGLSVAQENLEDLRQPVGERHAPWAFGISHWFIQDVAQDLRAIMSPAAGGKSDDAYHRLAQQHPYLERVVPAMLDRGILSRAALRITSPITVKSPVLLAALRDFGLGQRGPDAMRSMALQTAVQAG